MAAQQIATLVALAALPATLVVNEILYDPPGADAGGEYVELYNPGAAPVALTGLRLEFANGAVPPNWRIQWESQAEIVVPAGDHFLIVDAGWTGSAAADAEADLALQNGPDAVRLVGPAGVLDLVGYGDLVWPDLYEGRPAAVATANAALARRPDGHDTDDNAADFVGAVPTPGGLNFAAYAIDLIDLSSEPPAAVRGGETVRLDATLRATGLAALPAADGIFSLAAAGRNLSQPVSLLQLAAGDSMALRIAFVAADTGRWQMQLRWPLPAPAGSLTVPLGNFAVGPASVVIGEVMAAPAAGGEWVELRAVGPRPVMISDLRLRDSDGGWRVLPPEGTLLPDERFVVVEDAAAFHAHWSTLPPVSGALCAPSDARAIALPGWPALNNSAPESRSFADRVLLADQLGVIDYVTVGPGSAAGEGRALAGRSLERLQPASTSSAAANWSPCTAPAGGTPGCPNSVAASGSATGRLSVDPNPFTPGSQDGASVHFRFILDQAETAFDLRLFDLWGQPVRDLGGDRLGAGPRHLVWDGRGDAGQPLPAGAYVALLRRRDTAGLVVRAEKTLVVIATSNRP